MFEIQIATDNDAFTEDPGWEVARCLRDVLEALENGRTAGTVLDVNGNRVGTWTL